MSGEVGKRDICVEQRQGGLKSINDTHPAYDALGYPMIHPYGEHGYHFGYKMTNPQTGQPMEKKVSSQKFYCHRIMVRQGLPNFLHRSKQLFNQYLVDMFCKFEGEQLLYLKLNQKDLRVESYEHLRDALVNDKDLHEVGKTTVLPSSHVGSPRYYQQKAQDALAYVSEFGKPDLFITMTCNPQWPEITRELYPGQKPNERHDIICRVFKQKLDKLKEFLLKTNVFGEQVAHIHTIEFQKVKPFNAINVDSNVLHAKLSYPD